MTKVIAELSANHGGSLDKAISMIGLAKQSGAWAAKLQTYEPDEMPDQENRALYEKCRTPREWYPELFRAASNVGIELFSSVFSLSGIMFLEQFEPRYYKIASPESTRLPEKTYIEMMWAIRKMECSSLMSSGRADMSFVQSLKPTRLLYCVAGYPATITEDDLSYFAGLKAVDGFSDHTPGLMAPAAFVGLGATVIEKHFKIDDDCVDAAFSINPTELAKLCKGLK